ncbi:regulatory protein RecX [Chlamydiota bacterium]
MKKGNATPFSYSLKLLSIKDRTEKELVGKLLARGYDRCEVLETIERLKKSGYLNDSAFCKKWLEIRLRKSPVGRFYCYRKLRLCGVSDDIIEEQMSEVYPEEKEYDLASELVEKKLCSLETHDQKQKEKVLRFLLTRGFSRGVSLQALRHFRD